VRIVSLLPSATEIVHALGLADQLVGVTFECDYPPDARTTARVVVGGADTSAMTPGQIDAYVRQQLAIGGELYVLHAAALADLDPDLVLTQDLCRVCALPSGTVTDALNHLGCNAAVLTLDPYSLPDVLESIQQVGVATGADAEAQVLVASLRERLDVVRRAVAGEPKPRVAVLEWTDPLFAAGHWIPDLVAAAGGLEVLGTPGGRSGPTSWQQVIDVKPDLVVVAPCGYGLAGSTAQAEAALSHLPPTAQVWAIDADGLVVRPGPRLIEGVEALAHALHPDVIPAPPGAALRLVRSGQPFPQVAATPVGSR
jgi:iron complex transport system substrate-binding protein